MEFYQRIVSLGCTVLLSLCGQMFAQGYAISDTVPDFTDLTANCVIATHGTIENPFAQKHLHSAFHSTIMVQGTDQYTSNKLNVLPPGESKVVKLGYTRVGGTAESITYHFKVDGSRSLLSVKFAVVLEDGRHRQEEQSCFTVRVMDENGVLIDPCAEYTISARTGMEGFHTSLGRRAFTQWCDWMTMGVDLSRYTGRAVQVQFLTYACSSGACGIHFGYAYYTASCIPNKLSVDACSGNEVTLLAPIGFAGYEWDDGTLPPSRTVSAEGGERKLSCELTSVTGCTLSLGALLSSNIPSGNVVLYDTICEGDLHQNAYITLPAQKQIGTQIHTTTLIDPVQCKEEATATTYLTVQQKFYPLTERICYGDDFQQYGFDIRHPDAGVHRDTLHLASTTTGCDSVVTLTLYVDLPFSLSGVILGNQYPCGGSVEVYTAPGIDESIPCNWHMPEGYFIADSSLSGEIQLVVTDKAESGNLTFTGTNGCGSGSVSLPLAPHPVYLEYITDTVCTGSEYHLNGFHIPSVDSAGYYQYSRYGKTVFGCDSNAVLELYIAEMPSVHIEAGDSILCSGNSVTLQAVTGKSDTIHPLEVAIGDIYCTDKTIVKPEEFAASEKTAMGVIFWVHKNGKNGWIVALDEIEAHWASTDQVSVPGLPVYTTPDEAYCDTNGYANTAIIRNAGDSTDYPAVYNVDFENGWYIPASAQINQLMAHTHVVNTSLSIANGKVIGFISGTGYWWSSTVLGSDPMYYSYITGNLWGEIYADWEHDVRSVYSF